jgi:hypothetical protein
MGGWPRAVPVMVAALALTTSCLSKRDGGGGSEDGPEGAGGNGSTDGSSGGGDPVGTEPAGPACECAVAATAPFESCEFARAECEYDPYCLDWLGCFEDCADDEWTAACLAQCESSHPGAASMGYSIVNCVCVSCAVDPTCAAACQ